MTRRAFITLLGGAAAAWPLAARAQQSVLPVIGVLSSTTAKDWAPLLAAFLQGLGDAGVVVGRDVAIEYRWAEGQYDRLPALAAELIHRQVSLIAALTTPAAVAAKAATDTIPIVFTTIGDPVQIGLVASLSRPGGNTTGVTYLNVEVGPKLLELLHEMVPSAAAMAALVNPTNPNAKSMLGSLHGAARTLGLELQILNASTDGDIDAAFASLGQLRVDGLIITSDAFLITREEALAERALRENIPVISQTRAFAARGGLMSYTGAVFDVYRQAGVYTGRVLKGERPADLPVQQTTKLELIVNLRTAKALGLEIPATLLARADEVIE
jgi:putative tryptophan/tyrosine transport system substrate-binding protein